ncbi:MAG: amidohydrolase family protein [bacterium]|nr:amidohydrolase family protein [bacterium]
MARAGYKIFDADTHLYEPVEQIEAYLSAADLAKLDALAPAVRRVQVNDGISRYRIGQRPPNDRRLGSYERVGPAAAVTQGIKDTATPWDVRWQGPPFPNERASFDPHARVKDMDIEGIDVNMVLPSGGLPALCSLDDVALEVAMYEAYHRFLNDFCAPYADRLTSLILVSGRHIDASVAEMQRCGKEDWPVGILPICPPAMSLDEPAWEPIWAAAQENDLTIVIHAFTLAVPRPPGILDLWENVFLQRSVGHMWNAQRNMAALIGAGVLDRYPELRLTSLECGHGWLPAWAARLDEVSEMCRHALPSLQQKPSDYIRGAQYFQGLQLHEGEMSVRHTIEALGEATLMFATDYPHSESWFPKSVDGFLAWQSISDATKQKLLWDNALSCYRRYSAKQVTA